MKRLHSDNKKAAGHLGGGGGMHTPCTLPLDPPLVYEDFLRQARASAAILLIAKSCLKWRRGAIVDVA